MGERIELEAGETLRPGPEAALQLHEGVVVEVREDAGRKFLVDVYEAPAWLPSFGGSLLQSRGVLEPAPFVPSPSLRFTAIGPAVVERHKVERVHPLDVLGERIVALRRRLLQQIEPFQDFLDPVDGSIPRADYAATDVDTLILPTKAQEGLLRAARAEGLTPLGDVALEVWTAWRDFGALGRSTEYDEVAWFLPTRERVLFCGGSTRTAPRRCCWGASCSASPRPWP